MNKIVFILGLAALTAFAPAEARAHGDGRECFSYRSGSGSVEICTGAQVPRYVKTEKREVVQYYYAHPVYIAHPVHVYGPPGHVKHKHKARHERKHQWEGRDRHHYYILDDGSRFRF